MNWFLRSFTYSIGKKIIMSLTGLFLVAFVIEHVSANFLLFAGDKGVAYNEYSHFMSSNIFIRIIEIFLFASFIFHAIDGIILWRQNSSARGQGYAVDKGSPGTFWTSRNMIITGSLVLLFLLIHLGTFFVPYRFTNNVPDLFDRVRVEFQNPFFTGFYVFSMIMLALHLHHGFASAFQTIGLRSPKYYPAIKFLSVFLSIVICAGFASQPLYFLLFY
jgi:succinate dehydrogenase / fumarate reductase, cytochrome b subunit